jgi:hypothetical protein
MAERKTGSGISSFMERQRTEKPEKTTTKNPRKQLLVYMFPEGIKELKLIAAEEGRTMSSLVSEAVNEWLQKRGRPPVA